MSVMWCFKPIPGKLYRAVTGLWIWDDPSLGGALLDKKIALGDRFMVVSTQPLPPGGMYAYALWARSAWPHGTGWVLATTSRRWAEPL